MATNDPHGFTIENVDKYLDFLRKLVKDSDFRENLFNLEHGGGPDGKLRQYGISFSPSIKVELNHTRARPKVDPRSVQALLDKIDPVDRQIHFFILWNVTTQGGGGG